MSIYQPIDEIGNLIIKNHDRSINKNQYLKIASSISSSNVSRLYLIYNIYFRFYILLDLIPGKRYCHYH